MPHSGLSLTGMHVLSRYRDVPEMLSRALDNVGKVCAVMGKFEKALEL